MDAALRGLCAPNGGVPPQALEGALPDSPRISPLLPILVLSVAHSQGWALVLSAAS